MRSAYRRLRWAKLRSSKPYTRIYTIHERERERGREKERKKENETDREREERERES